MGFKTFLPNSKAVHVSSNTHLFISHFAVLQHVQQMAPQAAVCPKPAGSLYSAQLKKTLYRYWLIGVTHLKHDIDPHCLLILELVQVRTICLTDQWF